MWTMEALNVQMWLLEDFKKISLKIWICQVFEMKYDKFYNATFENLLWNTLFFLAVVLYNYGMIFLY